MRSFSALMIIVAMFACCLDESLAGMFNSGLRNVTWGSTTYGGDEFSSICVGCHTENPSMFIPAATYPTGDTETTYRGSHFVFNWLDGTQRQTNNTAYEKLTEWGATGGFSKYGNTATDESDTGVTGELICESCHNILINTGYKLLLDQYDEATGNAALCEGCHTAQSSGPPNHHPLSGNDVGPDGDNGAVHTLDITHFSHLDNPPPNGINRDFDTYDVGYYNGKLVCMSCHKPHKALTATGARILRRGKSSSTNSTYIGKSVNLVYVQDIPIAGYAAGEIAVRSPTGFAATGLHRQVDMDVNTRLVTNADPLCESCH